MASADYKHLDDRIRALTGIGPTDDIILGYMEDWIKDAIREIYSFVPKYEKFRYSAITATINASTGLLVADGSNPSTSEPVLSVIWSQSSSFGDGETFEAREMLYSQLYMFNKSYSLFKGEALDPLYYYEPQTSGVQIIKAYPSDGFIKLIRFDIPDWDAAGSNNADEINTISTIPNEVDHLIVLNASIKALTYLLQSEQDEDIYVPLLNTTKADYIQSVQLYLSQFKTVQAPDIKPSKVDQSNARATSEELQQLIQKYQ